MLFRSDSEALDSLRDAGFGGNNITINVGTLVGSEESVSELARMIDRELFSLRANNESVSF